MTPCHVTLVLLFFVSHITDTFGNPVPLNGEEAWEVTELQGGPLGEENDEAFFSTTSSSHIAIEIPPGREIVEHGGYMNNGGDEEPLVDSSLAGDASKRNGEDPGSIGHHAGSDSQLTDFGAPEHVGDGENEVRIVNSSNSEVIGSPALNNGNGDKNEGDIVSMQNETDQGIIGNHREEVHIPHPDQITNTHHQEQIERPAVSAQQASSTPALEAGKEISGGENISASIRTTLPPEREHLHLPTEHVPEPHGGLTESVDKILEQSLGPGERPTEAIPTEQPAGTSPRKPDELTEAYPAEVPDHGEHIKGFGTESYHGQVVDHHDLNTEKTYTEITTTEEPSRHLPDIEHGTEAASGKITTTVEPDRHLPDIEHGTEAASGKITTTVEPDRHLPVIEPGAGTFVEPTNVPHKVDNTAVPEEHHVTHYKSSTAYPPEERVVITTTKIPEEIPETFPPTESEPISGPINTYRRITTDYVVTSQTSVAADQVTTLPTSFASTFETERTFITTPTSTETISSIQTTQNRREGPNYPASVTFSKHLSMEPFETLPITEHSSDNLRTTYSSGTPTSITITTPGSTGGAFVHEESSTSLMTTVMTTSTPTAYQPSFSTTETTILPETSFSVQQTTSAADVKGQSTMMSDSASRGNAFSSEVPHTTKTPSTMSNELTTVEGSLEMSTETPTSSRQMVETSSVRVQETCQTSVQSSVKVFESSTPTTILETKMNSETSASSTESAFHEMTSTKRKENLGNNTDNPPSQNTSASTASYIFSSRRVNKKPSDTPKVEPKPSFPTRNWNTTTKPHGHIPSPRPVLPPVFIRMQFRMTMSEFCSEKSKFITELTEIILKGTSQKVEDYQIVFLNSHEISCMPEYDEIMPPSKMDDKLVRIDLYVIDVKGEIDVTLTINFEKIIEPGFKTLPQSHFSEKLVDVKLVQQPTQTGPKPEERRRSSPLGSGITVAIVIASVGGFCCFCLIILQIVIHRRHGKRLSNIVPGSTRYSIRSMDSIALGVVPKSRPHSGLWNPGLNIGDETFNKQPSRPLGYTSLSNFTLDTQGMEHEFEKIPYEMPSLSSVPVGAEDKNRFANVIPYPQTRVKLKKLEDEDNSDYINANYVTGYNKNYKAYIATQAPMTNTMRDFWRMVWEQQSRVILMLTAMDERGQPRCPQYWPDEEGMNGRLMFGDYTITLKKKDVHQEYITSVLELKDIENNLLREIRLFWLTCWPNDGIPEPISLIKFILDTRVHYEDSGAPVVVHCSPGTGRTGTLIATDICMRSYEKRRMVDVLNTVHLMREERAGAVQTKDQYILIYKAVYEYAVIMSSPSISTASSAIALHNML